MFFQRELRFDRSLPGVVCFLCGGDLSLPQGTKHPHGIQLPIAGAVFAFRRFISEMQSRQSAAFGHAAL